MSSTFSYLTFQKVVLEPKQRVTGLSGDLLWFFLALVRWLL